MILAALLLGFTPVYSLPSDTVIVAPNDTSVAIVAQATSDTLVTPGDSASSIEASVIEHSSVVVDQNDYRPGPIDFITNLPGDWIDWTKAEVTTENIPMMVAIGVATAGLVLVDKEGYDVFRRPYLESPDFRKACDMGVFIGDGKFQFGLACLFGTYGLIAQDSRAIRTASQTTEVILACGAVVQLLKHLTGRESPFVATSPTGRWALLPNQIAYHKHVPHYDAFPSGHVATALATLTVITENYPEATWIPWIGYPAIGALAVGMVGAGIHWWSDYPLAIALGYTFGKLVGSRRSDDRDEAAESYQLPDRGPHIGLSFLADQSPAIGVTWSW